MTFTSKALIAACLLSLAACNPSAPVDHVSYKNADPYSRGTYQNR